MPILEINQVHEYLDSQPSGKESPSESGLFGSIFDQEAAASAVSPNAGNPSANAACNSNSH